MQVGIKVGLQKSSFTDLQATQPDFCEVWFHSAKIDQYNDLFSYIQSLGIGCGLHFWGAAENTLVNLCFPYTKLLAASRALVKKTIDVAAKYKCRYVNIHPGGARKIGVDFTTYHFYQIGEKVSFSSCINLLRESLSELTNYAVNKKVELYVESVPAMGIGKPLQDGPGGRTAPLDLAELPLKHLEQALTIPQLYFTNDFGHTAANIISTDRTEIYHYLYESTKRLAPKTRLLHSGFIISPYNGTDYHGSLYEQIFQTKTAIPNKLEMLGLLNLFRTRSDVGVLVEPESDHVGNFQFLKTLISELS